MLIGVGWIGAELKIFEDMKESIIELDGAQGEGGGQVLRSSLALSMVTGKPFRIHNIRAGRSKPGLMRQHLTSVNAAASVGGAKVTGAEIGSTELEFRPGGISGGEYRFAVGTAGSATLVLQTVLPALLIADKPSLLTLEGGTHNPFAPPFDFLEKSFIPILERMGHDVQVTLKSYGFYPAGGGEIQVRVTPKDRSKWRFLDWMDRGEITRRRARILVAHLPESIGKRQVRLIRNKFNWSENEVEVVNVKNSPGPGNAVIVELQNNYATEVVTGFGSKGAPSESVIKSVVQPVREYLVSTAPVGEHLADQLMIPCALMGQGRYRAIKASSHAVTNRNVLESFLSTKIDIHDADASEGGDGVVFLFEGE